MRLGDADFYELKNNIFSFCDIIYIYKFVCAKHQLRSTYQRYKECSKDVIICPVGKREPITWLILTDKVSRISIPMRRAYVSGAGTAEFLPPLKPTCFSVTAARRSVPISATSRCRCAPAPAIFSHPFTAPLTRFLAHSARVPIFKQQTEKCIDFRCVSSYASAASTGTNWKKF